MKEIPFRKVDALLIKFSLNGKFMLIAGLVTLTTLVMAYWNHQATATLIAQHNQALTQARLEHLVNEARSLDLRGPALARFAADNGLVIGAQPQGGVDGQIGNHTLSLAVTPSPTNLAAAEANDQRFLVALVLLLPLFQLCYWISTSLGSGLWLIYNAIGRLAKGDLTQRLNFFGTDDFSLIAREVDGCADNMSEMVNAIGTNVATLNQAASEFTAQARNGESLIGAQNQFIESVAVATNQMTGAIEDVSGHANETSHQTRRNTEQAKHCLANVAEATAKVTALSETIHSSSSSVSQLADAATEIGAVVTTIDSISEQTNLLALNAAIEAARAGEQGRGFAVVADEVRTLAGRTQQATVEIQKMIEGLQNEAAHLSTITQSIVAQADEGRETIAEVGRGIDTMVAATEQVFDRSARIASATEEQSVAARDIGTQLSEVSSQASNLGNNSSRLMSLAEALSQSAGELDRVLERYQTA